MKKQKDKRPASRDHAIMQMLLSMALTLVGGVLFMVAVVSDKWLNTGGVWDIIAYVVGFLVVIVLPASVFGVAVEELRSAEDNERKEKFKKRPPNISCCTKKSLLDVLEFISLYSGTLVVTMVIDGKVEYAGVRLVKTGKKGSERTKIYYLNEDEFEDYEALSQRMQELYASSDLYVYSFLGK